MKVIFNNPFIKPAGMIALTLFIYHNPVHSQSFGASNIVVVRVGTGLDPLVNTGSPVFLDEYTPAGVFVSQTTIPASASGANKALILGGTGTTEGMITRSDNGQYLVLAGYNRNLPIMVGDPALSGTPSASVNRSVARIDFAKNIDLTTGLTDYASSGSPRSAITSDGQNFWASGGTGGIRYFTLGNTTSTQIVASPTNTRCLHLTQNQIYCSSSSGSFRMGQLSGGASSATGQTFDNMPGLPATGSPYQFFLADQNAAVPGPDVLYIADDGAGIIKYSLVGGTWTNNGTVGAASDLYRGLTGYKNSSDNSIVLFATRKGGSGSSGGGELVSLTDASGYNGSIGLPTVNVLATASTNQAFRGVALAPIDLTLPVDLLSFSASATTQHNLVNWTTSQELNLKGFTVQKSTDGLQFTNLAWVNAKGHALYNAYAITDKATTVGAVYYRLQIVEKDGRSRYSKIVKLQSLQNQAGFSVWPNPVTTANSQITLRHPAAKEEARITLYSADGKMILQYPVPAQTIQTAIALAPIPAGPYYIVFTSRQYRLTQHISVQ